MDLGVLRDDVSSMTGGTNVTFGDWTGLRLALANAALPAPATSNTYHTARDAESPPYRPMGGLPPMH